MSAFPNSPKLTKGAIIGLDPFNPLASVVIFQYNPEKLSRSLTPQTTGGEGQAGEPLRFMGPPRETISVSELHLDATDQLETNSFPENTMGISPQLSALEMLLYPKSAYVIANEVLLAAGLIEVIPPEAPLTLFIWGLTRIVPVKLTSVTISEEAYDQNLNPIQATVSLEMQVLNYIDFGLVSTGGVLFMAHQVIKEVMATIGSVNNVADTVSGLINA